jgi:hypothetical protein
MLLSSPAGAACRRLPARYIIIAIILPAVRT